jgi:putative ABC transport system ATP-binding protein
VLDLIISLQQKQGRTMVLVTHDASIAERAGRILHMMDGRIISDQSVRAESITANRA